MKLDKEVYDLFYFKCKKCGSEEIDIFSCGYGGEILIVCEACDNEKEI